MPKHRNSKQNRKKAQEAKVKEIQKQAKEYFEQRKPDDQKSLYDRLGNQDAKVRETAYITLSTIDVATNRGICNEIFDDAMTQRIVKSLSDPIRKNALCVFAAISNVLTSADLIDRKDVLEAYLKHGLIDDLSTNIRAIAVELTENWDKMHNNDVEKFLLYIENAYKLLDTIVLLESICVEDSLDYISQHENMIEMTLQIMMSKQCEYIKEGRIWLNTDILYWITHFMFSLTKENPALCDKLKGVEEIGNYIQEALSSMEESNIHICSNLCGLSFNLSQDDFKEKLEHSEAFLNFVHQPLCKILVGMNSPQAEFNDNFAENLESIKEALSSNNEEDKEESISNEKQPSSAKLSQMLSDFLNEMSSQVKKWKNFALGNVTALEIYSHILADKGKV